MYKQFSEELKQVSKSAMNAQKEMLEKTFESWRGGLEQIDDVLVLGIRI